MNTFLGIGNLTKDPSLKTTPGGKSVCTFTIAINRGFGDKKQTDYIDCVAWEKTAEAIAKHMSKGKKMAVQGRIQKRNYDDQHGNKRYVTEIVCSEVEFLSPMGEKKEKNEEPGKPLFWDDPDDFEPADQEEMPF